jgi:hypothetical protein
VPVRLAPSQSREAGNSVLVNGARGTRDIEGKVTRVGASQCGQRTSFKTEATHVTAVTFLNQRRLLWLGRAVIQFGSK